MHIEKIGNNHSFLALHGTAYESFCVKMKGRKASLNQEYTQNDHEYTRILNNLSDDGSVKLRHAASLDKLHYQQNLHLNMLLNSACSKHPNNSWNGERFVQAAHQTSWANSDNRANISSIEGYIQKFGILIEQIINNHPQGIEIIHLHQILSDAIGEEFDPRRFGSLNLLDFLKKHYSKIVDVKRQTHGPTGILSIFIYKKGGGLHCFTDKSNPTQAIKTQKFRSLKLNSAPFKTPTSDSIDFSKQSPLGQKGLFHRHIFDSGQNRSSTLKSLFKSELNSNYLRKEPRDQAESRGLEKGMNTPRGEEAFNISYLDDLPSLILPENSSLTESKYQGKILDNFSSDYEPPLKLSDRQMRNSMQSEEVEFNQNNSHLDLKEMIEFLGQGPYDTHKLTKTFFSLGQDSEMSHLTIPSEISNLSGLFQWAAPINATHHHHGHTHSMTHSRGFSLDWNVNNGTVGPQQGGENNVIQEETNSKGSNTREEGQKDNQYNQFNHKLPLQRLLTSSALQGLSPDRSKRDQDQPRENLAPPGLEAKREHSDAPKELLEIPKMTENHHLPTPITRNRSVSSGEQLSRPPIGLSEGMLIIQEPSNEEGQEQKPKKAENIDERICRDIQKLIDE